MRISTVEVVSEVISELNPSLPPPQKKNPVELGLCPGVFLTLLKHFSAQSLFETSYCVPSLEASPSMRGGFQVSSESKSQSEV